MNKIVYAALLIGLTSTVADAARVRDGAPVACSSNASQTCQDAANTYNAIMSIPTQISTVMNEQTANEGVYQQAKSLVAPTSGLSNMVTNCKADPSYSAGCPAAEAALAGLNAALSQLNTDLSSTNPALTALNDVMQQQQNDTGMAALQTLVTDLNALDNAVAAGQAIQPPPTMKAPAKR